MDWLGNKLGYETRSDWYKVKHRYFIENHGTALINSHMHCGSPSAAVMQTYSEHDWKGWLFDDAPKWFWDDVDNVKKCIPLLSFIVLICSLPIIISHRYGLARR